VCDAVSSRFNPTKDVGLLVPLAVSRVRSSYLGSFLGVFLDAL
jgi:hypothetical protein